MGATKRAVVIGINDYKDEKIEDLSGAVNDATEMRDLLRDNGGFIIEKEHSLLDSNATGENIRAAISDLLWKTEQCDIALFYFSGHGGLDHFEQGYLLPHDVDSTAPFVKGIRIPELKELFLRSVLKKVGILILDCCYSGIATQVEKSSGANTDHIKFREDLRLNSTATESTGSGRFIWASVDSDKKARELEQAHAFGGEKHPHGVFTFNLIEGLKAGPKDEFGRVNLHELVKYVDRVSNPEHKPHFSASSMSGIHDIIITIAAEEYQKRLREKISEIKKLISTRKALEAVAAIEKLTRLEKSGVSCSEISDCYESLNNLLDESKPVVFAWWTENNLPLFQADSHWYELLDRVASNFELSTFRRLDVKELGFVSTVIRIIEEKKNPSTVREYISMLDRNDRSSVTTSQDIRALPPTRR
jgi:hypothetical protein